MSPNLLTDEHRKEIRFLEKAYEAGFHPCKFFEREYQAHVGQGRYGWIIYRGRMSRGGSSRWEVWLDEQSGRVASYWVDDFDSAAESVLQWLEESDAHLILEKVQANVVKDPFVNLPCVTESNK